MSSTDDVREMTFGKDFEIIPGSSLGCGAYGNVQKGKLTADGSEVAIKEGHSAGDESVENSLKTDINMIINAHQLGAPNVIKLHGYSWDPKTRKIYMIMELMHMNLREAVAKKLVHPLLALKSIAETLKSLHNRWKDNGKGDKSSIIIHRDVKPENILVRFNFKEKAVEYKLSDFGTAKFYAKGSPLSSRVGTAEYAPPRYYKCDGVDHDVYSFGKTALSFKDDIKIPEGKGFWELMENCIGRAKKKRPSMAQVYDALKELCKDIKPDFPPFELVHSDAIHEKRVATLLLEGLPENDFQQSCLDLGQPDGVPSNVAQSIDLEKILSLDCMSPSYLRAFLFANNIDASKLDGKNCVEKLLDQNTQKSLLKSVCPIGRPFNEPASLTEEDAELVKDLMKALEPEQLVQLLTEVIGDLRRFITEGGGAVEFRSLESLMRRESMPLAILQEKLKLKCRKNVTRIEFIECYRYMNKVNIEQSLSSSNVTANLENQGKSSSSNSNINNKAGVKRKIGTTAKIGKGGKIRNTGGAATVENTHNTEDSMDDDFDGPPALTLAEVPPSPAADPSALTSTSPVGLVPPSPAPEGLVPDGVLNEKDQDGLNLFLQQMKQDASTTFREKLSKAIKTAVEHARTERNIEARLRPFLEKLSEVPNFHLFVIEFLVDNGVHGSDLDTWTSEFKTLVRHGNLQAGSTRNSLSSSSCDRLTVENSAELTKEFLNSLQEGSIGIFYKFCCPHGTTQEKAGQLDEIASAKNLEDFIKIKWFGKNDEIQRRIQDEVQKYLKKFLEKRKIKFEYVNLRNDKIREAYVKIMRALWKGEHASVGL
mmetsp:Transcript_19758/g.32383  ORF Transcript_19758/g.32383 Transcript_19758/m.32383 type:complete len:822 (-) Transcript_19758:208-2673(-)